MVDYGKIMLEKILYELKNLTIEDFNKLYEKAKDREKVLTMVEGESLEKHINYTEKKEIKNFNECPECGGNLQNIEGCITCECGYSKCE